MNILIKTLIIYLTLSILSFASSSIHVPNGSSAKYIVKLLKNHHIISYETPFYWYLKLTGADHNLRAGTFILSADQSYAELSQTLQEKNGAASLKKITIPEGYSLIEIAQLLEKKKIIQSSHAFLNYVQKKVNVT